MLHHLAGAALWATLLTSSRLQIGARIASGNYGIVHKATFDGRPVVAKAAAAALGESEELARAYLDAERRTNEAIGRSSGTQAYFPQYFGCETTSAESGGKEVRWLIFEHITGATLDDFAGRASALREEHGLTLVDVLGGLLKCTAAIHELGYVHRDIKLANVLLDESLDCSSETESNGGFQPFKLIDLGSSAMADGCTVLDSALGQCTAIDPDRSPCSPLYAPPEQFVNPEHPWAFDVFAIAMCVLRIALRRLGSDEGVTAFRTELAQCGGHLDEWVRNRLADTAIEPTLLDDLTSAFPSESPVDGFALLAAMLRPDPAARPSVDALLAHPYLSQPSGTLAPTSVAVSTPRWLSELLDGDSCEVTYYETRERPLAVSVRLRPPLGLLLSEDGMDGQANSEGRLTVDGFVEGSRAEASGAIAVGDRLVRVGGRDVRSASLEEVSAMIAASTRGQVELSFERDCTADGCDVRGTEFDAAAIDAAPPGAVLAAAATEAGGGTESGGRVWGVLDAGVASSIGQRASQEDSHVLTSWVSTPRFVAASAAQAAISAPSTSYVLAACFDGHRGPKASEYAAARLAEAVRRAVERGEPSPLAAGWRAVADGYAQTGAQDGACATMVLIADDGRMEVVNCGDSRTMLAAAPVSKDEMPAAGSANIRAPTAPTSGEPQRCVVEYATRDHCASDSDEGARIVNMGGQVRCAAGGMTRVSISSPEGDWQVAVARALGGSEWKGGGITDAADVSSLRLDARHRFLVLASDGVTGPLEDGGKTDMAGRSAPIAWRVAAAQAAGARAGAIAQGLVACAASEGGSDNATCIVLLLGDVSGAAE